MFEVNVLEEQFTLLDVVYYVKVCHNNYTILIPDLMVRK